MVSDARAAARPSQGEIWAALEEVPDPEIPAISVVDLGIVWSVRVSAAGGPLVGDAINRITVKLLPTFVGCPALEVMRETVRERLERLAPGAIVEVEFGYAEPWTSDRITPQGRERLRTSGFAPPERAAAQGDEDASPLPRVAVLPIATCPHCGSRRTRLESPFGPTLCRAIYHCSACRQPFEAFKAI